MTPVIRTAHYRMAARRVMVWCAWYTRDIDPIIAAERQDEIASDLYEEGVWAQEAGLDPRRTARSILLRAARGVPADLSWRSRVRRGQGAAEPAGGLRARRAGQGLAGLLVMLGIGLTGLGVFALIRTAMAQAGTGLPWPVVELIAVMTLTIVSATGTILAAQPRTRLIGALALLFPAAWMTHFVVQLLWYSSATVQLLLARLENLPIFVVIASVGLTLIPAGAALWWLPLAAARRSTRSRQTGADHG